MGTIDAHRRYDLARDVLKRSLVQRAGGQVLRFALHPRIAVTEEVDRRHTERIRGAEKLAGAKLTDTGMAPQQLRLNGAEFTPRRAHTVHSHSARGVSRDCAGIAKALVVRVRDDKEQPPVREGYIQPTRVDADRTQVEGWARHVIEGIDPLASSLHRKYSSRLGARPAEHERRNDPADDRPRQRREAGLWRYIQQQRGTSRAAGPPWTQSSLRRSTPLHQAFVDVAPDPALAGLDRPHYGMASISKVPCRMLVPRRITAADLTAAQTHTKMDPFVASRFARFARQRSPFRRLHLGYVLAQRRGGRAQALQGESDVGYHRTSWRLRAICFTSAGVRPVATMR